MNTFRIAIATLALVFTAAVRADDIGPDGLSAVQVASFATGLQAAVRAGSPDAVAHLVSFPLRVNGPAGKHRMVTAQQFGTDYAKIFTPAVRTVVLAQDPKALFRNSNGFMFGNGEVWAAGICKTKTCEQSEPKITSVSLAAP